jgi:hypothetical protein
MAIISGSPASFPEPAMSTSWKLACFLSFLQPHENDYFH